MRVGGRRLPVAAPEDLLLIKALATAEHAPRHWYDALAILSEAELDWDRLVRRSRGYEHRMLSLLRFAASDGVGVPVAAMRVLQEMAEEHPRGRTRAPAAPPPTG